MLDQKECLHGNGTFTYENYASIHKIGGFIDSVVLPKIAFLKKTPANISSGNHSLTLHDVVCFLQMIEHNKNVALQAISQKGN